MLRKEHNVKNEVTPTGTYKQTKQKDQRVFMEKYRTPVFEQMDMKQDVLTVENSSDHSGCCRKRQTKHEQTYYYTDHQQLVSSKQMNPHKALGALREYLQTTEMSKERYSTCAIKDLNKH